MRQALNYAVDVNAIVKSLYFGYGTRLATVVDKGALGYDPSIQPYPYDPAKAKALLGEAGFPNGFETEFDSFTGSIADHSKPAEAIVGFLQKVGVKAKLNVFEFAAFGPRRVQNRTAPLFIYSIGNAYLEPSWVLRWMTQGGLGMHYKNAKLDEMLTRIEATDDPKKRAPQYTDGPEARQGRGAVHLPLPGRRGVRDEHPDRLHAAAGRDPVAVHAGDQGMTCAPTSRRAWPPPSSSSSASPSSRSC